MFMSSSCHGPCMPTGGEDRIVQSIGRVDESTIRGACAASPVEALVGGLGLFTLREVK